MNNSTMQINDLLTHIQTMHTHTLHVHKYTHTLTITQTSLHLHTHTYTHRKANTHTDKLNKLNYNDRTAELNCSLDNLVLLKVSLVPINLGRLKQSLLYALNIVEEYGSNQNVSNPRKQPVWVCRKPCL